MLRFRWEALAATILDMGIAFQFLITLNELIFQVGRLLKLLFHNGSPANLLMENSAAKSLGADHLGIPGRH